MGEMKFSGVSGENSVPTLSTHTNVRSTAHEAMKLKLFKGIEQLLFFTWKMMKSVLRLSTQYRRERERGAPSRGEKKL